jgi:hypothetical protein
MSRAKTDGFPAPVTYGDTEKFLCRRRGVWTDKAACAERALVALGKPPCGECALGALWLRKGFFKGQEG